MSCDALRGERAFCLLPHHHPDWHGIDPAETPPQLRDRHCHGSGSIEGLVEMMPKRFEKSRIGRA
jgi:hypothetical protein